MKTADEFDIFSSRDWAGAFARFDAGRFEQLLKTKDENVWLTAGRQRALDLFFAAAKRVPAYRYFLKKNRIDSAKIKTAEDFKSVPATDKENYINAYPLAERCWDGRLAGSSLVAMSSGTGGEPKFWPRSGYQEFEAGIIHELLYRSLLDMHKRSTLLVIGFPMGVYVSGIATLLPSWLAAPKKYGLTVVSVGNNKEQMLKVVDNLGKHYEQVVLIGHPFFIKDVVETGTKQGVDWPSLCLRMVFCSEGFSETWRSYLIEQAGSSKIPNSAINTYGSSETLLVGHETQLTIALRKKMDNDGALRGQLAGRNITPNIFQYNPLFRHIESVNDELLFTMAGGIPLIRFNLHDSGRVIEFSKAREAMKDRVPANTWRLPLVTLNGRSDHTMVFYAANIYPEHIHTALDHKPFLKVLTGKFAMRKDYDKNMDQFLELNVELKPGVKPTLKLAGEIRARAVKTLRRVNMEYLFLCNNLDKDLAPRIVLRQYQDPEYFKPGLKPRYIIK